VKLDQALFPTIRSVEEEEEEEDDDDDYYYD
jgi:hypothetical protein